MDEVDRRAIELFRDELADNGRRLYDHVADTFRWLVATLFAANGGALLAVSARHSSESSQVFFAAGVVFSLMMGVASIIISLRMHARQQ